MTSSIAIPPPPAALPTPPAAARGGAIDISAAGSRPPDRRARSPAPSARPAARVRSHSAHRAACAARSVTRPLAAERHRHRAVRGVPRAARPRPPPPAARFDCPAPPAAPATSPSPCEPRRRRSPSRPRGAARRRSGRPRTSAARPASGRSASGSRACALAVRFSAPSAAATAPPCGGRTSGSFASIRQSSASKMPPARPAARRGAAADRRTSPWRAARRVLGRRRHARRSGTRTARSRARTRPPAHRWAGRPRACSGDMYPGVPISMPVAVSRVRRRQPRDAEVEHLHLIEALVHEEDVAGLEIAVNDAARVRRVRPPRPTRLSPRGCPRARACRGTAGSARSSPSSHSIARYGSPVAAIPCAT